MTEDLTLNMNAYLPLRDVVFNTLREAILKGELQPGERLMELQLAAKLGVSRTPIREAIRMLEQEGFALQQNSQDELDELRRTMREFEESTKTGDIKRIAEADVKFHDIIYRATRNPKLENMLSNLREQMYRYRVEYLKDEKNYPVLFEEHSRIVEGLAAKDKDMLTAAMHEHVRNQAEAVKEVIREQEK